MSNDIERNLGEQPIAGIMSDRNLKPHDLVEASSEQITHKMVSKACKGRRLTPNVQGKVQRALNTATGEAYELSDLFNY
jgi:hypothetical protein